MRLSPLIAIALIASCGRSPTFIAMGEPEPEEAECTGVDFSTDPQNCGACRHDCAGSTCELGQCKPASLWATPQTGVTNFVLDGKTLFFINGDQVFRQELTTGCGASPSMPEPVAPAQYLRRLYVDGDYLYSSTAQTVVRFKKDCRGTCTDAERFVLPIPVGTGIRGLAFDATHIYWAGSGTPTEDLGVIGALDKTWVEAKTLLHLHQGAQPRSLSAASDTLFWMEDQAVSTSPFNSFPDYLGSIRSMGKDQTLLTTLVPPTTDTTAGPGPQGVSIIWANVSGYAVDEHRLYEVLASGDVLQLEKNGGTPTLLHSAGPEHDAPGRAIVISEDQLYWLTSKLNRIKTDGTGYTSLGSGFLRATWLTLDERCAYWVDTQQGMLYRVAR